MNIRHFIFDVDGTLQDNERVILAAWQNTLSRRGYQVDSGKLRAVLGVTWDVGLQRLGIDPGPGFIDEWRAECTKNSSKVGPFPQIPEMLRDLRLRGMELGIVSSRRRQEFDQNMPGIDLGLIGVTVLQEDTLQHKPHPEPLLKYAALSGARPEECIYIGDVVSDIQCAASAGMVSGLAAWNGSGIVCPGADYAFHTPMDVLELARANIQ